MAEKKTIGNKRLNEHGERLTKRQTQSLRSRLGSHARNNCASYTMGGCPFPVCVVEIQAERIAANVCPYFINYVLPSDPRLEEEYAQALPDGLRLKEILLQKIGATVGQADGKTATGKRCETCYILFEPRSNRQKYCESCSEERRRQKDAERKREARLKKAMGNDRG